MIKPDYYSSLQYIQSIPRKTGVLIIGGDPQALKYYNDEYIKTNYYIVHPHTNFEELIHILDSYSKYDIYAVVDHDLYVNKNDKIDERTIYYIKHNMTKVAEFNSIEIYKQ